MVARRFCAVRHPPKFEDTEIACLVVTECYIVLKLADAAIGQAIGLLPHGAIRAGARLDGFG